jgi:hypothetical protein
MLDVMVVLKLRHNDTGKRCAAGVGFGSFFIAIALAILGWSCLV